MIFQFFKQHVFAWPWAWWLLLWIPVYAWLLWKNRKKPGGLFLGMQQEQPEQIGWKARLYPLINLFRILAFIAFVIALARPQKPFAEEKAEGDGIDIIICMDVSGSMLAQDFEPNRLEAAKAVASSFIESRKADRIGLVIFSGESFTLCPLTTDHDHLKEQVWQIKSGQLEDGTAIGSGLATSLDRLQQQKTRSKVVILLTDGENNGGDIGPLDAITMASSLQVKVYTIGVGTEGFANVPVKSSSGEVVIQKEKVNIDEALLQDMARKTGGRYFRAKDNEGLQLVYREIDRLEKSKVMITKTTRFQEKYTVPLLIALSLLFIEFILRLWWRRMI